MRMSIVAVIMMILSTSTFAAKPVPTQWLTSGAIPGTSFWCSVTTSDNARRVVFDARVQYAKNGLDSNEPPTATSPVAGATDVQVQFEEIYTIKTDEILPPGLAYCYVTWKGEPDDLRGEFCSNFDVCTSLR
jgi:hypothetical protein